MPDPLHRGHDERHSIRDANASVFGPGSESSHSVGRVRNAADRTSNEERVTPDGVHTVTVRSGAARTEERLRRLEGCSDLRVAVARSGRADRWPHRV